MSTPTIKRHRDFDRLLTFIDAIVAIAITRRVMFLHRVVARWLVLWTLTIVFLPFPTALVANVGSQWLTKVLYIGTVGLSMIALVALEMAVVARPRIRPGTDALDPSLGIINVILVVRAPALSLAIPAVGYFPFLLTLDDPLRRLYQRLRHLPVS